MIDEQLQELAAQYALNALDSGSVRSFEAELARNAELRDFADDLRESAASLAHTAPRRIPPPELRERVMSAIRAEAAAVAPATPANSARSPGRSFLPWMLAAGFAITTAAVWFERGQWRNETLALRQESLELRNRDSLATMKIASLGAQIDAFAKGTAVVVWDPEKQRGIIRLSHLPQPAAGKDYQLWVIDPKYPKPVNGGIIPVDQNGYARVSFAPDQPIKKADKFAISVEPTGGVPQATGPIVLIGD